MRTPVRHRAFILLAWGAWGCCLLPPAISAPTPEQIHAALVVRIESAPIESTSIASIGFAKEARVMEIKFRSGAVYRYLGVPSAVFTEFQRAESKGRYFAQRVRGKYDFCRVEPVSK